MEKPITRPFVEKRLAEVFTVGFTFSSPELAAGETITGGAGAVDPAGLTINSTGFTATTVYAMISAGVDGEEYQLTLTATTSAGHTLIGVILVRIIY